VLCCRCCVVVGLEPGSTVAAFCKYHYRIKKLFLILISHPYRYFQKLNFANVLVHSGHTLAGSENVSLPVIFKVRDVMQYLCVFSKTNTGTLLQC
jgi:hypothetical protein